MGADMGMKTKRLVVLQPQLSLTGSGRLLESLLGRTGGRAGGWDIVVWTELPGELDQSVGEAAEVRSLLPAWASRRGLWFRLATRLWANSFRLGVRRRQLRAATRKADLVLVNTTANNLVWGAIHEDAPVVLYVHELELSIVRLLTADRLSAWLRRASSVIVASEHVADELCRWHGEKRERLQVIHPWLCQNAGRGLETNGTHGSRAKERREARIRLGLPEGARVVLGCGYVDWIKGPDVFLEMVRELSRDALSTEWRFIWLGKTVDAQMELLLNGYARHLGVEGLIQWVAETAEPGVWIAAADVLALTSRAESYGMVALEAACSGVPVAYFQQAGGPAEFLSPPLGWGAGAFGGTAMATMVKAALAAAEDASVLANAAVALRARHDAARQGARLWAELGRRART